MRRLTERLMLAACAAVLIAACAKKTEETETAATAEETADDAAVIGTATVWVTLNADNNPAFGTVSEGFCSGGSCSSGFNPNAAGNVDLSWFAPGDVTITITLDDKAWGAGWRFPTDPYQAVAIAVDPPGDPTAPIPVFGQAQWPAEFEAPSVSGQRSIVFIDKEDDQNAYEYSIQLQKPDGGMIVMDPTIQNGGRPPMPEPEPVPQ